MDNSKDTDDILILGNDIEDTITLPSLDSLHHGFGAVPPDLTLSSISLADAISISNGDTITISPSPTYTINTMTGTPNTVWATSMGGGSADWSVNNNQSATIKLSGEDADIDINGKSMKAWMEQVEQRLNILVVNPELEDEWAELKELGDRYRELEKLCKEKADIWTKLKSMPPPLDL